MADAIWTATSGGMAQQQALQGLTHDLANVSTYGFKGSQAIFIEAKAPQSTAGDAATNLHVGLIESVPDWTQGALVGTENPLHVAIDGAGFFVVRAPLGERLTRSGAFSLGADGLLRDNSGYLVEGDGGLIAVPQDQQVSIDADGVVLANNLPVDRLKVVDVADRARLHREAQGLWDATDADPFIIEAQLRPLHLEASNVSPILATTQMVNMQRAFESYLTTMRITNDAEKKLVNEVK